VPLFANDPEVPARLDKTSAGVTAHAAPLVINDHSAGHYIVHYADPGHMAQITKLIAEQKLGTTERLMLLNSASMLSKAGIQSFGDVLQLLDAYRNEHAEPVWEIIALIIGEARRFIDLDESLEQVIKDYIRTLTASELKRLGWQENPGEPVADSKLRATIIGLNSYAETPAVIKEAVRQFKAYIDENADIVPELRSIVFGVAVKENVPGAVDYLLALHDKTPNSDLKADAMSGLTSTRDNDTALRLLDRLKDASLVKPQDADYWIFYLLRNRYTRETTWQWMVNEWPWIIATYAHDKSYDDFPRYAAGICNTQAWQQRYTDFFAPKRNELELERNINIGLSEISTRVNWLVRDLRSVQQFFKK
jgi:aminopeptidase N